MKPLYLFVLLLLLANAVNAQSLIADRPSFVTGPFTMEQGEVQIELGATWTTFDSGSVGNLPEGLVRWGFAPNLEVRLGVPDYNTGEGPEGFGDSSIGVKYQFATRGSTDLGLTGTLGLPTGEEDLAAASVEPSLVLGLARPLSPAVSLEGQFGLAVVNDFDTVLIDTAAIVSTPFSDQIGGFVELFAIALPDDFADTFTLSLQSGLTLLVNPNVQLDVRAGTGIVNSSADAFIGAGASFRLQ